MKYHVRDDGGTGRREKHTPAELIDFYETGQLDSTALVAAEGDSGWQPLEAMLPLLRQDASDSEGR